MGGPRPWPRPHCHAGVLIMDPYTLPGRIALIAAIVASLALYHHLSL